MINITQTIKVRKYLYRTVLLSTLVGTSVLTTTLPSSADGNSTRSVTVLRNSSSAPPPGSISLTDGILRIESDKNASFPTEITAAKGNGAVTIDVDPENAGTGKTLILSKLLKIGFYTTVNFTSDHQYRLYLPTVTSNAPGPVISPTSAGITVGTLDGAISIAGTSTTNSLEKFTGPYLQKQGTGTWTITGDNSKETWGTAVNEGELILQAGASLSTGGVSVGSTFSLQSGTVLNGGVLSMRDHSTLNLADGKLGTFTVAGQFCGPNGGNVTLKFDISDKGVDQLFIADLCSTNDIRDFIVFNKISKKLKPGKYTLITLTAKNMSLMENHFGFSFTGDPADHSHVIRTQQFMGYTLTLEPVIDAAGNWTGETVTVS